MGFDINLRSKPHQVSEAFSFGLRERLLAAFSSLENYPMVRDEEFPGCLWEVVPVEGKYADLIFIDGWIDSIHIQVSSVPRITHDQTLKEIWPIIEFLQKEGLELEKADSLIQDYEAQTLRVWKVADMLNSDEAEP